MFYAIKGSCNAKHKKGFHISRPDGLDHYVILIIKSHGEFVINGISGLAAPGNAFQIPFQNLRLSIQNSVAERHTKKNTQKIWELMNTISSIYILSFWYFIPTGFDSDEN